MEVNTGKKHLKEWKNCYYKQYKNRCEVIAKMARQNNYCSRK